MQDQLNIFSTHSCTLQVFHKTKTKVLRVINHDDLIFPSTDAAMFLLFFFLHGTKTNEIMINHYKADNPCHRCRASWPPCKHSCSRKRRRRRRRRRGNIWVLLSGKMWYCKIYIGGGEEVIFGFLKWKK